MLIGRPMALGSSLNFLVPLLSVFVITLLIFRDKRAPRFRANAKALWVLLFCGSLHVLFLFLAGTGWQPVYQLFILLSFVIASLLSFNAYGSDLSRYTRYFLRFVVFSGIVTAVYFWVFDESAFSDTWSMFEIETDRENLPFVHVRFPLSTLFTDLTTENFSGARSSFMLIEPGIAPALLVLWRALEEDSSLSQILLDFLFIAAMAATLSTTAPLALALYFFARSVSVDSSRWRWFNMLASILVGALFLYALFFLPYFGYFAKLETHSASFTDRIDWFLGDQYLYQFLTSIIAASVFAFLKGNFSRKVYLVAPTLIVVVLLNVIEFSPLFIMAVFCVLNQKPGSIT